MVKVVFLLVSPGLLVGLFKGILLGGVFCLLLAIFTGVLVFFAGLLFVFCTVLLLGAILSVAELMNLCLGSFAQRTQDN